MERQLDGDGFIDVYLCMDVLFTGTNVPPLVRFNQTQRHLIIIRSTAKKMGRAVIFFRLMKFRQNYYQRVSCCSLYQGT